MEFPSIVGLVFALSTFAVSPLADEVAAHPGEMIEVPPGRHEIDAPLMLNVDGGGLYGYGTIVQTNPAAPIVRVDHAAGVRIEGVTLTRAVGAQDATEPALRVDDSRGVAIRGVRVHDNHSQAGAIALNNSERITVSDCEIVNYKTVGIDDRTTSPLYGYAFHCIDGTGIVVNRCVYTTIANNRVVEERLLPTREAKATYTLGALTDGRQPLNPGELARGVAERGYVDNWHQGSAIVVTGPEHTRHTIVQGNLIVNAAQAIDMHCDYANVSGNVIERCMIGIKGTHGCYGVVVSGNTITGADLWGMLFNPGAASHGTEPAEDGGESRAWNGDAGLIIANNLIAAYGYGNDYWNWGGREPDAPGSYAIAFLHGQLKTNPPYQDILLTGNTILAGANDQDPNTAKPRYRYAIYLEGWRGGEKTDPTAATGLVMKGNIIQPGLGGLSNAALEP